MNCSTLPSPSPGYSIDAASGFDSVENKIDPLFNTFEDFNTRWSYLESAQFNLNQRNRSRSKSNNRNNRNDSNNSFNENSNEKYHNNNNGNKRQGFRLFTGHFKYPENVRKRYSWCANYKSWTVHKDQDNQKN